MPLLKVSLYERLFYVKHILFFTAFVVGKTNRAEYLKNARNPSEMEKLYHTVNIKHCFSVWNIDTGLCFPQSYESMLIIVLTILSMETYMLYQPTSKLVNILIYVKISRYNIKFLWENLAPWFPWLQYQ